MASVQNSFTPIQEFYNNSVIFATGCTGFIGKCLLYKLLLSCPKIKKIYILVRERNGKTTDQRIDELLEDMIFKKVKEEIPNYREMLGVVQGDLMKENLGISEKDRNLLINEVNIVFHVAATVRFDEKIRIATKINLLSTKEMITLCKECKHVNAIVHVSTAYSHCYRKRIEEKFFTPVRDPHEFLDYVKNTSDEELEQQTESIIGDHPNTYTFTKGLAEEIIRTEGKSLPIVLYRPSIVHAAWEEPVPGYVDNLSGPSGLAVGVGNGFIHVLLLDPKIKYDIVPVDMVVNSMITVAKEASKPRENENIPVYNFVSGNRNPVTLREFIFWCMSFANAYIISYALWHYFLYMVSNRYLYRILSCIFHDIPAFVIDSLLQLVGKKSQLKKIYGKIYKMTNMVSYFALNEWNFSDDNIAKLWETTDDRDKKLFPFDIAGVEWDRLFFYNIRVIRSHLMKDPLTTVHYAQERMARFRFLHYTLRNLFIGIACYIFYIILKKIFY